jgi:hypothetical protein
MIAIGPLLKFLDTPFTAVGLKRPAAAIFIEANFLPSR